MQPLKIHYLQHVPFEGLGSIADWAQNCGHTISCTRLYANDPLPEIDRFDMLIIMGGPMGVNDESIYPWLKSEKEFIRKAIEADKYVVGICLGSQLIADVMGAKVYANAEKEIGWFDIYLSNDARTNKLLTDFPPQITVFHWHGDTLDLPAGAALLMSSEACKNQAYLINNKVLGLQFHFETTQASLTEMIDNGKQELVKGNYIQSAEEIMAQTEHIQQNNQLLAKLLTRLTSQDSQSIKQ